MMRIVLLLILLSGVTCSAVTNLSPHSPQDDVAIVRDNVRRIMLWPRDADELNNIITYVYGNISLINNKTCYFIDLDYTTRGRENWDPILHMLRLYNFVQVYTYILSPLYNNTVINNYIHCLLNVWFHDDWQNPNWWWNTIQDPLISSSILLMMGIESFSSLELKNFYLFSSRANWWINDWGGGANLVWELQIQLYICLANNNITGINQAFNIMWNTVIIQDYEGQGIMPDYSYHFHGLQLLTGAYGTAWATNILHFWMSTRNTQYVLPDKQVELFATFLAEGDAWFTHGNHWDSSVVGRIIDRQVVVWYSKVFPTNDIRLLANNIQNNTLTIKLLQWADRLDGHINAVPLNGNRHSFTSDYQTHRRTNWTASIKMHSIRTIPTECDNSENMKGEHLADGVLNLYTRQAQTGTLAEYHSGLDTVFPIIDWQALNGITNEYDIPILFCNGDYPVRKTTFVGGVSNGWTGIAYMDTATHNLTAKRSWHFYDNMIIALANDINLDPISDSQVSTSLASRLLPINGTTNRITLAFTNQTTRILTSDNTGIYKFKRNELEWFHADGIGYIISPVTDYEYIIIDARIKTGNALELGPWNYTVTGLVFVARIAHRFAGGPRTNLSYTYFLLPNISAAAMPQALQQIVTSRVLACAIISSTPDEGPHRNALQSLPIHSHATLMPSASRATFVLWNDTVRSSGDVVYSCSAPASIDSRRDAASYSILLASSDAAGYLFDETDDSFTVSASHPTRLSGNVTLRVDRQSQTSANCQPTVLAGKQGTAVTIALPTNQDLLGQTVAVVCKKTTRLNLSAS